MQRISKSVFALLSTLALTTFVGCASVEVAKSAQGTGQKKIYRASLEDVWVMIPKAIAQTGGVIKESDKTQCSVLADYGVSLTSWGERVGVFCYRKSESETEVEVVSKRAIAVNVTASDWTSKIFNVLDNELQRGPSYQEGLLGGFDPKEWTVGHQTSDQNQRIVEFVRPREKIDSWTELFTMQTLRKPTNPEPIDAMVARVHADDAKLCPNGFEQNVIAKGYRTETEEASILYEWKFKNCPPHADQHEVARVIYGKFNIFRLAYVTKTQALAPEKRDKVIKELSAATIMVTK